jgi:hypothetical protein
MNKILLLYSDTYPFSLPCLGYLPVDPYKGLTNLAQALTYVV